MKRVRSSIGRAVPTQSGSVEGMYLYILQGTRTNKYYIGVTTNLDKRLEEHNTNTSHYTGKQHEIWNIIFSRYYEKNNDARIEEIRLKKAKNKKYINWYIRNMGP